MVSKTSCSIANRNLRMQRNQTLADRRESLASSLFSWRSGCVWRVFPPSFVSPFSLFPIDFFLLSCLSHTAGGHPRVLEDFLFFLSLAPVYGTRLGARSADLEMQELDGARGVLSFTAQQEKAGRCKRLCHTRASQGPDWLLGIFFPFLTSFLWTVCFLV